jgi:DNA-binding MarR family transcriptional regulator
MQWAYDHQSEVGRRRKLVKVLEKSNELEFRLIPAYRFDPSRCYIQLIKSINKIND